MRQQSRFLIPLKRYFIALADHIAFAAKESRKNIFIKSLVPDIKNSVWKEYAVALKSREIIEKMTGYRISDDEAGLYLHIHSGLSDEQVSDTLKTTQIIDDCILMIESVWEIKYVRTPVLIFV